MCQSAATSATGSGPMWIELDHELGGNRGDLRRVQRADGIWRRLADPVSRDELGLAGERPRARRHHDGVRGADRRIAVAGFGEFDGVMTKAVQEASHRRCLRGRATCARGASRWGRGKAGLVDRERLRGHHRRARHRRGFRDPRILRALRARLPAKGRRRGNRRAHSRRPSAAGGSARRVRAVRLSGRRLSVGRVPLSRQVPAAERVRDDDDRARGLRTARRSTRQRRPEVRRRRRPAGRHRGSQGCRHDDRRRLCRVERDVLVRRRRQADSGRAARHARVSAGAALRAAALHGVGQRHVRRAAV